MSLRRAMLLLMLLAACIAFAQEAETGFEEPYDRPDNPDMEYLAEPAIPDYLETRPPAAPSAHELPDPGIPDFRPGASELDPGRTESTRLQATVAVLGPELVVLPGEIVERGTSVLERWPAEARRSGGILADRQVVAYYGHPNSEYMGVLGESAMEEMAADLKARAAEYDALNGDIGVAPAFHLIYGTVYEDASIGLLRRSTVLEYIEFAAENGILVFLDHQIGRFTVAEAIGAMLPYLEYENVHLAIDPEWATTLPGEEIGQIRADELNAAQQSIEQYMIDHGIAGTKMLVVHQFSWKMIGDRHLVRTDFERVNLIHNADGFGSPQDKFLSWEFNVQATNMPLKGFKLFYPKSWRNGGFDDPLLSPEEVLQLDPVPVYIQYQ